MQKISGILPNSSRVSSVDLKEAAPVRPGTPSFGRPEGVSSLRDRPIPVDAMKKTREISDDLLSFRSKDAEQAEAVQKLSDRFFNRNRQDVGVTAGLNDRVETLVGLPSTVEGAAVAPSAAESGYKYDEVTKALREPAIDLDQPYPKGSFVDVVA